MERIATVQMVSASGGKGTSWEIQIRWAVWGKTRRKLDGGEATEGGTAGSPRPTTS